MQTRIWISVIVVLLLLGFGKTYVEDAATVDQALAVEEYLKGYCRLHNRYPEMETLESKFPELSFNADWYYWPNETLSSATFQYPMTLPLPSAPGRSKFSEFFPVIYSFAVRDPCDGLLNPA